MVCYKLEDYPNALEYAKIVQEGDLFLLKKKRKRFLVEAKSQFELERYDIAAEEFKQIAEKNNNEIGSEAKYLEAEAQFKMFNLEQTEATLQQLFERKPSYEYWVVKGYILIADLLLEQNDTTQAKLTYQSIINNYKGEELLNIAQTKFDDIIEAENRNNNQELESEDEEQFQNDFLEESTTEEQEEKVEEKIEKEEKEDEEGNGENLEPNDSESENNVQPEKHKRK